MITTPNQRSLTNDYRHPLLLFNPSSVAAHSPKRQASNDINMCRPPGTNYEGKTIKLQDQRSTLSSSSLSFCTSVPVLVANLSSIIRPPYSLRRVLLLLLFISFVSLASLYTCHRGFRRTIQFWRGMTPLILKYKYVTIKAQKFDRVNPEELERRLNIYREQTAPKLVELILKLKGIYVKLGQVMSTVGQGLLPQVYLDALRPLQNGVPPRSYAEISKIITQSTGKSMEELFLQFDEVPIGSASIAQVHRATLRPNSTVDGHNSIPPKRVVVKVQYPEVAQLFDADLSNLELATRLFSPEYMEITKSLRKRHENELDFTKEAANLIHVTRDMQRYGVEPSLVRIPRVIDDICTKSVLAMEYLEGTSLGDAIDLEQRRVAKALGMHDGDELKTALATKMRKHYENGGGVANNEGGDMMILSGNRAKLINVFGPSAAALLRTYALLRDEIENVILSVFKFGSMIRINWMKDRHNFDSVDEVIHDDATMISNNGKKRTSRVNLGRALKTLVHVHGIQLLLSGVYNADPHPGNVLILPDGRLGLLDYGMVGRLSPHDREAIAKTIIALSNNDKQTTARIFRENGYAATFRDNENVDDATLHRFATFCLDKFDLSPITLDNGEVVDTMELFRNIREKSIPTFVEDGRRLGGLLMGVNAQAARPISLAKEWKSIAQQALRKK